MHKKMPIFYSALLLTGVNLLLRFIGTSFQVYLSGRIGAEGIGLLQLTMSVGTMAMVAGMGGIRTATMYLTAEELGRNRQKNVTWVLSACIIYSLLFSGTVGTIVYLAAPQIAGNWIGNREIIGALRLYGVFLPVCCLSGVMIGYFTGANRIGTLAAVEVAEQLFSMVCTILLLNLWAGNDPVRACKAVILGGSMGACMTLCALVILRIKEHAISGKRVPMTNRLLQAALPLAVADDLRTGISTAENLMVPKRLALYPGTRSALADFGIVSGMVFPILMFPAAILFGLTELLIPELARCQAAGGNARIRYLVRKSLGVALLYGSLCGGILFLCADELGLALYHSSDAGRYLKWFSLLSIMLYLDAVTDAMIKGLGQQKASVRYNIITNTMDVILLFILLPKLGIFGYFVSFLITHIVNFVLSLRRLLIISKVHISPHLALTCLLCVAGGITVAGTIDNVWIRGIGFSVFFGCLLFAAGVLSRADVLWLKGLIYKK